MISRELSNLEQKAIAYADAFRAHERSAFGSPESARLAAIRAQSHDSLIAAAREMDVTPDMDRDINRMSDEGPAAIRGQRHA